MISKIIARGLGLAAPMLIAAAQLMAQTNGTIDDLSFRMNITEPRMDIIRFGDLLKFDPNSSGGSSRIVFRGEIKNNSSSDVIIDKDELQFNVKFNGNALATLKNSKPVTIAPNEVVSLSNINALKASGRLSLDGDFSPENVISALFGSGKKMTDISTGSPIPAGEYSFSFGTISNLAEGSFTLSNPSGYIALIGPGSTFLEEDPAEIFDRNPAISWTGDASEFELRIVQVDRTVDKALGDLLSKSPQYSEITKGKFRRYPQSDLVAGKVYAILVSSRVNSLGSSKPEETWAVPFWFTIPQSKTASEVAGNDIIAKLKAIFGDQYATMFEQIRSGNVKGTITIDGKTVTFQELAEILQKLQTGDANLESIDVK
ncbi:MAG: hypothetical protein J0L62_15170 [Bacteroidetes bacterium]|nr:hypothetical protein [Bacteroidota bacterium]